MARMKVVSENTILETLSGHGGMIRWDGIRAKAHLVSTTDDIIGAIRFET